MGEGLAKGVERTGADVAKHHTHGADGEGRETAPAQWRPPIVDKEFVWTGLEASLGGQIGDLAWRSR
jgi:hypothetical protein